MAAGLITLLGGSAMCVAGYYSKYFSSSEANNGTHLVTMVDEGKLTHMSNLNFLGPVLMGIGCFAMIVACVVICEQREKDIKKRIQEVKMRKMNNGKKKNLFYNSVVEKIIKNKDDTHAHGGNLKSKALDVIAPCIVHNNDETKEEHYSNISKALRHIPMELFTINMATEKHFRTTLLPIRDYDSTHEIKSCKKLYTDQDMKNTSFPLKKCPSDTCILELVKLDETRLGQMFPYRETWLKRTKTQDSIVLLSPTLKNENKQKGSLENSPTPSNTSIDLQTKDGFKKSALQKYQARPYTSLSNSSSVASQLSSIAGVAKFNTENEKNNDEIKIENITKQKKVKINKDLKTEPDECNTTQYYNADDVTKETYDAKIYLKELDDDENAIYMNDHNDSTYLVKLKTPEVTRSNHEMHGQFDNDKVLDLQDDKSEMDLSEVLNNDIKSKSHKETTHQSYYISRKDSKGNVNTDGTDKSYPLEYHTVTTSSRKITRRASNFDINAVKQIYSESQIPKESVLSKSAVRPKTSSGLVNHQSSSQTKP